MKRFLAVLLLSTLARAAVAQEANPSAPGPSSTPAPADAKELEEAVKAARDAAESAKVAAEAARAAAETLKELAPKQEEPKAPEAAKPAEKPASPWAYQVGVNFISITGNATNVAGKVALKVDGKWNAWAVGLKAGAAYGQATLATTATDIVQVTAQNADATVRGDRSFDQTFTTFLLAGAVTDRVASIASQAYSEAGVGIAWWEVKDGDAVKSRLATDFGFRYTREDRYRYFSNSPDAPVGKLDEQNIIAIRGLASLKYAIAKGSSFSADLEALPDLRDSSNLRVTGTATLSAQIDKGFALQLSGKARYIGVPAAGAKTTDTELGAGINYAF